VLLSGRSDVGERYLEEINFELARAIGRPRTVLDVGCGRGQNGELAKQKGARVVGIESWGPSVEGARNRLDEVIDADIETDDAAQRLEGRRFDLILFGDVLEHTRHPEAVLARFLPFLEDGGHTIVSLPNVAAWTVRLGLLGGKFDYAQSGILDETHLRFFTRKTAKRLVENAGLELLWVGLNPMIVRSALGVIRKLVLSSSNGEGDPGELRNNPLYKEYLRWVRPLEGQLAAALPGTLSFQTVVVARKRPARRKQSLTVGMISMNEEGAVGGVIDDIRRQVPDAEILLVDSSKDRTPQIAAERGARVIRQFPPKGYGPAMHRLLYECRTDVIVTLDCDGTYPADRIQELRTLVEEGADLVNATRTRRHPKAMPLPNYVANRLFAATAQVIHGLRTTDVHSGMRAYRMSMLRGIDTDPNGPALPVDLMVIPARLGYRIVEVEIPYFERIGATTLQRYTSTVWTFRRLFRASVGAGARARGDRLEIR
jgi:SAM-dependent methyltransferase